MECRDDAIGDAWTEALLTPCRLCGYPPFPQSNDISALRMIVNGSYEFHKNKWEDVSEDAKDFIRALLVPNPAKRVTAKQVPFFGVFEK